MPGVDRDDDVATVARGRMRCLDGSDRGAGRGKIHDQAMAVGFVRFDQETLGLHAPGEIEHHAHAPILARRGAHLAHDALAGDRIVAGCRELRIGDVDHDAIGIGECEQGVAGGGAQIEHDTCALGACPQAQVANFDGICGDGGAGRENGCHRQREERSSHRDRRPRKSPVLYASFEQNFN